MPKGQPFTLLCQLAARLGGRPVADLHVHTTASDGDYTPSQVVALAAAARLTAVAVTDHDTVAGVGPAREAAAGLGSRAPAVIAGVEASGEYAGREVHLLGHFVRPDDPGLVAFLDEVCRRRRARFFDYLARLADRGVRLPNGLAEAEAGKSAALGRRHLAGLLVRAGVARSRYDAFERFLKPAGGEVTADHRTPAGEVIRALRAAGGVVSLAHPPEDVDEAFLGGLRDAGLQGVEAAFPAALMARAAAVRKLADKLGLAVAGGSDCHGPGAEARAIGAKGVTRAELAALRQLAGSPL